MNRPPGTFQHNGTQPQRNGTGKRRISEPEAMFMITMGTTSGAIVGGFIGSGIPVAGTVVGAALGGAFGFIGSGIGVAIRYLVED